VNLQPLANGPKGPLGIGVKLSTCHHSELEFVGSRDFFPQPDLSTVLLEEPQTLEANVLQGDMATAKDEAERHRPSLAVLADGSRLDIGATGYPVV